MNSSRTKSLAAALLGVFILAASSAGAYAVENIDSVRLGGQVPGDAIEPFALNCKDFMALSPEIKLFAASWLDGYSSPGNNVDMFVPGDAKDFLKELGKTCAANPDKTVNDVIENVQYGNSGEPVSPDCAYLNSLESEIQAGLLIAWAMGYVINGNENAPDIIHFNELGAVANVVINKCKDAPSASVLELVKKELP